MMGGGTWKGHSVPGVVFVCWALWWAFQAFRSFIRNTYMHSDVIRAETLSYESRAWWRGFWGIEPVLKVFGPPVGILAELRLDHDSFL